MINLTYVQSYTIKVMLIEWISKNSLWNALDEESEIKRCRARSG